MVPSLTIQIIYILPFSGGNQFLEKDKNFNAYALSVINDNLGTTRLAGGRQLVIFIYGGGLNVHLPVLRYLRYASESYGKARYLAQSFPCLPVGYECLFSWHFYSIALLFISPFAVPYTTKGNAIIVFEGRSKTSWNELRNKLIGVTDPKEAAAGSIRNQLLVHVSLISSHYCFDWPLHNLTAIIENF